MIFDVVDRLHGSISAEHGIGRVKQNAFLSRTDNVALDLAFTLKCALDPHFLLSPGRILPAPTSGDMNDGIEARQGQPWPSSAGPGRQFNLPRDRARPVESGRQLPTEQALATTFGVSRNVVREAIASLRSEGRVWSQQGRGAFVADRPIRQFFRSTMTRFKRVTLS